MRDDPNITEARLRQNLNLGKTAIDKGIKVLKERGLVERAGAKKGGYWKVIE